MILIIRILYFNKIIYFKLKQKIYCAFAITSPRTRELFTPEEKQIYLSGIILVNGF